MERLERGGIGIHSQIRNMVRATVRFSGRAAGILRSRGSIARAGPDFHGSNVTECIARSWLHSGHGLVPKALPACKARDLMPRWPFILLYRPHRCFGATDTAAPKRRAPGHVRLHQWHNHGGC